MSTGMKELFEVFPVALIIASSIALVIGVMFILGWRKHWKERIKSKVKLNLLTLSCCAIIVSFCGVFFCLGYSGLGEQKSQEQLTNIPSEGSNDLLDMDGYVAETESSTIEPEVVTRTLKLLPANMDTESFVIERWVYDPGKNYQKTIVKYAFNTESEEGFIKFHRISEDFVGIVRTDNEEPYAVFKEYRDFTTVTLYINSDATFETVLTNTATE